MLEELAGEIHEMVRGDIAGGRRISSGEVTRRMVDKHSAVDGPDADLLIAIAFEYFSVKVRRVMSGYKAEATEHGQLELPTMEGWNRLRTHYSFEENKEVVFVPISEMSDEQGRQRVAELRAIGKGCFEHADELERYLDQRDPDGNGSRH